MQYPLGIKPHYRSNFDYIFLLAEDFYTNQKRIFEHYAGMFPNFKIFRDVFMEATKDYGCMVIVNKGSRSNILDKVFWYKASITDDDDIIIGSKSYRNFHKNNYDEKYDDDKNKVIDEYLTRKRVGRGKIGVTRLRD